MGKRFKTAGRKAIAGTPFATAATPDAATNLIRETGDDYLLENGTDFLLTEA